MTKKKLAVCFLLCLSAIHSLAQNKVADKKPIESPQIAVSYGIVVDNSGSFRMILDRIIETTKDIVEENKADDKTFLTRFVDSDKISILQNFTDSKARLQDAADEMFAEGGQTAILDAVSFSAKYLAEKTVAEPNQNKVLILISDGDDRTNEAKIEDVLKFLQAEKIRVFVVGISDEKVSTKLLEKLAKGTGGKVYLPRNQAESKTAIKELVTAIRVR